MFKFIISKDWEALIIVCAYVALVWSLTWSSIGIDLYYGRKKYKKAGVAQLYSAGLRRTWNKLKEYSTVLLFALFIDAINPLFFFFNLPVIPIVTIVAGLALIVTEFISVREKVDEKLDKALSANSALLLEVLKNNKEYIMDYIKDKEK